MRSSYVAAGVVVVLLALWMASGLLSSEESENSAATGAIGDTLLMKVEFITVSLSPMAREIVLQGQLEPIRKLQIRAETGGTVDAITTIKGQRVSAGSPIVILSLSGRDSELREAIARVKTAESEQQAATSLRKRGLQSQVQLEQAQAQLETARAKLARIELDISNTRIIAPFAGVINALPIEIGELISRSDIVAEIVDDSAFKITAQAAQQTIAQLAAGQDVSVRLITGQELIGKITFIASVANSDTRSFAVEAEVDKSDEKIAAGVSASLVVPVEQVEAVFITPSAISLGDDGELGVKLLDQNNRVLFNPISLLSTSIGGAWVTGIPDNSRVISLGQGFVSAGQEVDPRPSTHQPASSPATATEKGAS